MILQCTCKHDFQDRMYGSGNRIHNRSVVKSEQYKCTVCSDIKNYSASSGVAQSTKKAKKAKK